MNSAYRRQIAAAWFGLTMVLALAQIPASAQDAQTQAQPPAQAPAGTPPAAAGTQAPAAVPATEPAAVPADDNLNAVLWMQHAVEYQGSVTTAFSLAKLRLDQALADKKWTAVPAEQKGKFGALPAAVVCDIDETLLDNSAYQAWNITAGAPFSNETWSTFVHAEVSKAIPGALAFTKYAAAKGVKVFYVSNRTEDGEAATRDNMQKLGFPMGGNVDTFLMQAEQKEWTSRKGSRYAFIAKHYRILLVLGDNFGDFVDAYKGSEQDRQKVYDANATHWGHDWIVLPNPSYGSFEAVPYAFDYGATPDAMRDAKRKVLESWDGK